MHAEEEEIHYQESTSNQDCLQNEMPENNNLARCHFPEFSWLPQIWFGALCVFSETSALPLLYNSYFILLYIYSLVSLS